MLEYVYTIQYTLGSMLKQSTITVWNLCLRFCILVCIYITRQPSRLTLTRVQRSVDSTAAGTRQRLHAFRGPVTELSEHPPSVSSKPNSEIPPASYLWATCIRAACGSRATRNPLGQRARWLCAAR